MFCIDDYTLLVNASSPLEASYIPPDLIPAEIPFHSPLGDPKRLLRREAALEAQRLFQRSLEDGLSLWGISGYRSYTRQSALYHASQSGYVAAPGTSEHQTGLALDVSCPSIGLELLPEFSSTAEGKWLETHASFYGFILRYPKGKEAITGIPWEPWHIRYVTRPLASYLTLTGLTLDEYASLSFTKSTFS